MPENPLSDPISQPVSGTMNYNLALLRNTLRAGVNADVVTRRFECGDFPAAAVYVDGMANAEYISQHILRPLIESAPCADESASSRAACAAAERLSSCGVKPCQALDDVMESVLSGDTALFFEGCAEALVVDTKGFPKRGVEQPVNETTVIGAQEAFVENLKTNLSLLRRGVRTPRFVAEPLQVGTGAPRGVALVYLDGVCNEQILSEARRRITHLDMDYIAGIEVLEQLLEDSPHSLFPQFAHTERPDRAVSFLLEGMALILIDGSPQALGVPASLLHLIHAPDVTFLRYPAGTFLRLVSVMGVLLTAFLPGVYLSLLSYHNEVLPLALMTSIYETQSRVPIPVFFELLLMGFAFDLINTAGARIPGAFGQALGVVSALIIGQAAVTADLVSPMLIIVVAVSGLGQLMITDYNLSLSFRMLQLLFSLSAALGGLYGMSLALLFFFGELCSLSSMGVPFFYPFAPTRMHNPDLLTRYPVWQQRVRQYLANPGRMMRAQGRARAWEKEKNDDDE